MCYTSNNPIKIIIELTFGKLQDPNIKWSKKATP